MHVWAGRGPGKVVGAEFGAHFKELDMAKSYWDYKKKEKALSPGFSVISLPWLKTKFFEVYLQNGMMVIPAFWLPRVVKSVEAYNKCKFPFK